MADDKKLGKKADKTPNKTHAGGNYDRQDAYLYGHPQGKRKKYRSPADFFPHVLWLATDPEGDPKNCSCKICSPDGDEVVAEGVKLEAVKKDKLPTAIVTKRA